MSARILIVDDEKQLVYCLREAVQLEFPGSSVDTAYSGEEALSQMAASGYDLILADLRMPGLGGLELIRGVRYLDAQVPIVLMTGYGSEELQQEAWELGVDEYVDKPFEVSDMLSTVRRLLPAETGGHG